MPQNLSWILASLSLAFLLGAGLVWLLRRSPRRLRPLPSQWTLSARPVFSSDERRVYRQLHEALPQHIVLSKLPLVRFCQPSDPHEVRYWYELLGGSHVSFAICSANGRVLAAIDLDSERNSRRTVQIKQSVLSACKVRYLRCGPDQLPSIPELQLLVPQSGLPARGLQPAPAAAADAGAAAPRKALWQQSGFMHDSFFGDEQGGDAVVPAGFGSLRSGLSVREIPHRPEDGGGVVIDTPVSPRH